MLGSSPKGAMRAWLRHHLGPPPPSPRRHFARHAQAGPRGQPFAAGVPASPPPAPPRLQPRMQDIRSPASLPTRLARLQPRMQDIYDF